ncbi:MAG: sulfotransferase family protein [Marinicella sp.]
MNKLFIIGLPRTGTTSISAALLELNFKVAHTAFTKRTFELADVFSDTPCFCDYRQLDELFPNSKFVYLDRALDQWLPSIQMLLKKMQKNLQPEGHFNPIMKRCFNQIFELLTTADPLNEPHLSHCYQQHQQQVFKFFADRDDLLTINLSDPNSMASLLNFLDLKTIETSKFPHLNAGRMVTTWRALKHPNKINSNAAGVERRKYFDYAN